LWSGSCGESFFQFERSGRSSVDQLLVGRSDKQKSQYFKKIFTVFFSFLLFSFLKQFPLFSPFLFPLFRPIEGKKIRDNKSK
jgi:hypothetical protein